MLDCRNFWCRLRSGSKWTSKILERFQSKINISNFFVARIILIMKNVNCNVFIKYYKWRLIFYGRSIYYEIDWGVFDLLRYIFQDFSTNRTWRFLVASLREARNTNDFRRSLHVPPSVGTTSTFKKYEKYRSIPVIFGIGFKNAFRAHNDFEQLFGNT